MSEPVINRWMILTKTIPLAVAGFVVFLVYLLFFINVDEMIQILRYTNVPVFLFAGVASVLEIVFFALTWQYLLKYLAAKVSFRKIFTYTYISNFIDLMIPAESVSGELTRILLVTSDGVKTGKAAASVIIQRILGLCIVGGTIVVGMTLMLQMQIAITGVVQTLVFLIIAVTTIFLIIVLFIFTKERWVIKIVDKISAFASWISQGRVNTNSLKEKTDEAIKVFYQSLQTFRTNPSRIVPPIGLTLISWFFAILINYLAFATIGYKINWIVVVVGCALIVWLKTIPVGIPAEIGVTEIVMATVFGAFGVPISISAASIVLTQIITLLFKLCIGFVAFQSVGSKIMMGAEKQLLNK